MSSILWLNWVSHNRRTSHIELRTYMTRCAWVSSDPVYLAYHDEEWGVPVYDDQKLFEMIILEGAQAGLSWITVLQRREAYRKA